MTTSRFEVPRSYTDSLGNLIEVNDTHLQGKYCRLCGELVLNHQWMEYEHNNVTELLQVGDPDSLNVVQCDISQQLATEDLGCEDDRDYEDCYYMNEPYGFYLNSMEWEAY